MALCPATPQGSERRWARQNFQQNVSPWPSATTSFAYYAQLNNPSFFQATYKAFASAPMCHVLSFKEIASKPTPYEAVAKNQMRCFFTFKLPELEAKEGFSLLGSYVRKLASFSASSSRPIRGL